LTFRNPCGMALTSITLEKFQSRTIISLQLGHLCTLSDNFISSPTAIVKILKRTASLRLFKRLPERKKRFCKGAFWSPSYYIGTAGDLSAKTIEKYMA
jgi:hypothetical protein